MTVPTGAVSDATIRRLVVVKYLYRIGQNQAQEPEPICAAALLTFHDAIELTLIVQATANEDESDRS